MDIKDRLEAEVEELKAKVNPQGDSPEANTEENAKVDEGKVDAPEAVEPVADEPKKKRNDWKKKALEAEKRAAGLKAKTDALIHSSRAEIEAMRQKIAKLREAPVAEVDLFENVFTEEDTDTIGSEAVDIIKKASKTASEAHVKPLMDEIHRLKEEAAKRRIAEATKSAKSEYSTFTKALGKQVEDWSYLNSDPGFIKYLSEVNSASGYTRGDLLRRAEGSRDVERVAGFMKDYKAFIEPVDKLKDQVGPVTGQSASVARDDSVEMVPASEVDKFYEDTIRGVYKQNRQLGHDIKLKIEKAIRENRIDIDR